MAIYEITLSNNQFRKTCFATILLNRDIYHLSKYDSLPSAPKIKRITPLLAIEMKNLIDFDNPPTTSKPDLISTTNINQILFQQQANQILFQQPTNQILFQQQANQNQKL